MVIVVESRSIPLTRVVIMHTSRGRLYDNIYKGRYKNDEQEMQLAAAKTYQSNGKPNGIELMPVADRQYSDAYLVSPVASHHPRSSQASYKPTRPGLHSRTHLL